MPLIEATWPAIELSASTTGACRSRRLTSPLQERGGHHESTVHHLLLIAGLFAGCSGSSASDAETSITTSATSTAVADVVTLGNVALTDRQQEMVRLVRQYGAAWKAIDPAAVAAFFAPEGKLESILYEDEFQVSDATLTGRVQAAMNAFDMASLEPVGPLLVDGNVVYSVSKAGPSTFASLLVFTDTGTVRPLRHISLNS